MKAPTRRLGAHGPAVFPLSLGCMGMSATYGPADEAESLATIEGARVCGLEDRTGSLTAGKQADLVLIRGDQSNTYPVIDPVSTVVHQADTRNVDTVMVGGRFLKRGGELVGVDFAGARDRAETSLDHLLAETQIQPNWVQSRAPERTYS